MGVPAKGGDDPDESAGEVDAEERSRRGVFVEFLQGLGRGPQTRLGVLFRQIVVDPLREPPRARCRDGREGHVVEPRAPRTLSQLANETGHEVGVHLCLKPEGFKGNARRVRRRREDLEPPGRERGVGPRDLVGHGVPVIARRRVAGVVRRDLHERLGEVATSKPDPGDGPATAGQGEEAIGPVDGIGHVDDGDAVAVGGAELLVADPLGTFGEVGPHVRGQRRFVVPVAQSGVEVAQGDGRHGVVEAG